MAFQICDLEPTDIGAAIRLLEEVRQLPDSTPIEIDQFITEVNDGAVVVVGTYPRLTSACSPIRPGSRSAVTRRTPR